MKDLDQSPVLGRLVFLRDAKSAPLKSDLRSPPVCTLDLQLPGYDKQLLEQDAHKKRTTVERGMRLAFFNSTGSLATGTRAPSSGALAAKEAERTEFNLRLLANDLTNQEAAAFEWLALAQRLALSAEETDRVRNSSSNSPYLMSSSPANQTYDMLTLWQNKYVRDNAEQVCEIVLSCFFV